MCGLARLFLSDPEGFRTLYGEVLYSEFQYLFSRGQEQMPYDPSSMHLVSAFHENVLGDNEAQALDFDGHTGKCFAIQSLEAGGTFNGELTGRIEHSDDGFSWNTAPGATFNVVAARPNFQIVTFDRTKRYLRYACVVTGTPNLSVFAAIGQVNG